MINYSLVKTSAASFTIVQTKAVRHYCLALLSSYVYGTDSAAAFTFDLKPLTIAA